MKYLKIFTFLFVVATALISCNEETEVKTDGERLGEQISVEINKRTITSARVFLWTGTEYADFGQIEKPNYKIAGAFLVINNTDFYNFNQLERFNFSGSTVYFYFTK